MSNISLQVYVFFLKFKKSILLVLVLLILLWNFLGFLIFEGYLLYEVACVLQSPPVPVDSAFRLVPKSGTVIPCEEIYKLFPKSAQYHRQLGAGTKWAGTVCRSYCTVYCTSGGRVS